MHGKTSHHEQAPPRPGLPITALALRSELAAGSMKSVAKFDAAGLKIEIASGLDSLWVLLRRPDRGGLALRAAYAPGGLAARVKATAKHSRTLRVDAASGRFDIEFSLTESPDPVIRVRTTLTPAEDLLIPFLPRDLYPLDEHDNPAGAVGCVEAAQRGVNTGLIYFCARKPAFGQVLYVQNLTSLNAFFDLTKTKPDGVVGGEWPELGYQPPTAPIGNSPPKNPLPAGEPVVITDALLGLRSDCATDEQESGALFLEMLADIYRCIDKPETEFRDWPSRALKTLHDLDASPEATIMHYGYRYIHPYTGAEYPDSMVQMSVLSSLNDFAVWKNEDVRLGNQLAEGMGKFFDPKLKALRRYLPNVGSDKDKNAVDSWYLYHPVMNMGRLALRGDAKFKKLFLKSVEHGIKAAKHFKYAWPIQFKIDDFSIVTNARNDDGLGQTDVGGLYAYVMLQGYQLTAEERFLDEAKAAINAAKGMRFELNYQANLTAWGAVACTKLWRLTGEYGYLKQSYVYLASFLHNCAMWESDIEHARHYHNFLGATCLHDAPYMAVYECFDSFAAFAEYLNEGGPELSPSVRLLLTEYCKYALDRAWFYYPDALPADVLSEKVRNSHVDRSLSFPLEDLYVDGQPPGQVGQEIYGAGAAFVFASRSFHKVKGAPFTFFCDHFVTWSESQEGTFRFTVAGAEGAQAWIAILHPARADEPEVTVDAGGKQVEGLRAIGRTDYLFPSDSEVHIRWS